jgi:hypothetical protein
VVDAIDDVHYIRNVIENTAKESKRSAAKPSPLRFRGRRR